ncbi:MAG TPA: phosphoglucosamine mutase [Nitrospirae bacterium]|nr:phosphoglucosamine mutase [bacterium BMS3Abin10]GBE39654.1 phosphoglucosamine mutase [bacterium BMS3Bbin08]HDH49984.1 phosphoglucosamine mutase [Nitrospirota bacterium]HDK82065.1 phosphoglucosamine mutase [Nitrospirota bacterium]
MKAKQVRRSGEKKRLKLFGTDGIRGKANYPPMTGEIAFEVGRAAAYVLKKKHGREMILIGKDTRLSGYMLESALTSGICSMGMNVVLVGPMPTPGIAFVTRSLRVDAGIVISASHNPYDDNGIKFFSSDGFKLPDSIEKEIEDAVFSEELEKIRPHGEGIGKAFRVDDAYGRYIEYVKSTFPKGRTLEGIKIVVDCANGSTYKITPWVLSELGAEVIAINDKPDGLNINAGCGCTHPEAVQKAVLEHRADIGIAHDGDGDRTLLCDEKGGMVDGDRIMAMCALDMKKDKRLKNNTVVATVMSNIGFELFLKKSGIKVIRTSVGDRYVVEEMVRKDCNLGGEQSGHIIFMDHNTTGDGAITALQVLAIMEKTKKPLSKLASVVPIYPQILVNVPVKRPKKIEKFPSVVEAIEKAGKKLKSGRILVRPSGTEPKIRVMVEGDNMNRITSIADEIADVIRSTMA